MRIVKVRSVHIGVFDVYTLVCLMCTLVYVDVCLCQCSVHRVLVLLLGHGRNCVCYRALLYAWIV